MTDLDLMYKINAGIFWCAVVLIVFVVDTISLYFSLSKKFHFLIHSQFVFIRPHFDDFPLDHTRPFSLPPYLILSPKFDLIFFPFNV